MPPHDHLSNGGHIDSYPPIRGIHVVLSPHAKFPATMKGYQGRVTQRLDALYILEGYWNPSGFRPPVK